MISRFSDTFGMRGGRSERKIWRQRRWLPIALTIAATGLTGCGDNGGDEGRGGTTVTQSAETHLTTPLEGDGEPILIKTQVQGFTGKVLPGSVIGDSPFCPGGTVRHEHGTPEIGFPAINVFHCPDGRLEIGFGPGPDQMNNSVQTSDWKILDGSDRFARVRGHGQMRVRFKRAGSPTGRETFTGIVVVP